MNGGFLLEFSPTTKLLYTCKIKAAVFCFYANFRLSPRQHRVPLRTRSAPCLMTFFSLYTQWLKQKTVVNFRKKALCNKSFVLHHNNIPLPTDTIEHKGCLHLVLLTIKRCPFISKYKGKLAAHHRAADHDTYRKWNLIFFFLSDTSPKALCAFCVIDLYNHGMLWARRDHKDHLIVIPL